jgi:hypothetical protein
MIRPKKKNDEQIYCLGRKEWVAKTPEEMVRQRLFHELTTTLGFPGYHIAVEKALNQMPHLAIQGCKMPKRRVDLVCFAKGIHPVHDLYPLLIIECKAVKLTSKVLNQVVGYNHFIKSHFLAIANADEIQFGFYHPEEKQYVFISHIPTYQELLSSIK